MPARASFRTRLRTWGDAPLAPGFGRERAMLLAAFALVIVLRLPRAWAQGRFFGEEGAVFFAYAWHRPWPDALFRSFGGYLNLFANAITLVDAHLVRAGALSLTAAPHLTMIAATIVQLLPALLLLNGGAPWLARRWATIAGLLAIAVMPMTEEVFANVLHSQFHLALCAALIFAFDAPRSRRAQAVRLVPLVVAPLCGPGAIVLAPFFVLRAIAERDRRRAVQAGAIVLGAAIQLLVFFVPSPVRGELLGPATLAAVAFVRVVALPVGGLWLAKAIGAGVYHSYRDGGVGWWSAAAGLLLYAAALVGASLTRPRDAAAWLIVPAFALAAVAFGGGMIATDPSEWFNVGTAERYDFLPLVMLTLGLIALTARGQRRVSAASGCLLALTVGWSVVALPFSIASVSAGPSWSQEVARWRLDHRYRLRSWPASWAIDLSDRSRPCTPAGISPLPAGEPRYCDRAWLRQITASAADVRAAAGRERR